MVLLLGMTFASPLQAQSPADEFSRRQEQQTETQRLDALKRITPNAAPAANGRQIPVARTPNGPCFDIEGVDVDGVTQISLASIAKITRRYQDRCIGLGDINDLLRAVTHLYLDHGFVTSRAYVPEQDVRASKRLRVIVIEGTIDDIYVNGKPAPNNGTVATAFPHMIGRIANIRDVEQGLDQINRLSSNNAKTSMLPGAKVGTSVLNLENNPTKRWHASAANDNLGQESTGYAQSSLRLGLDDVLGINDQLGLSYQRSGPDYPWGGDGQGSSNSYSVNASIPYGYWTFSANGSWYDYESAIPGIFEAIETSGDSGQFGVGAGRVVLRDKDSITTVRSGLTYKQTDNFLLGNRIEVGSRRYSVGSLGLSHSRRMLGGVWAFDASYDQGLDLFGAVDAGEPGAGSADPRFSKFSVTLSITEPFEIAGAHLEATSLLSGQYSPDNLFGAEQISLGGYSNVRGLRESVLFGNNGMFTHNEFAWRTMPWANDGTIAKILGELRPYIGLDYGRVFSQGRFDITGGDLSSWTAGARLVGGSLNVDLGYSDILSSSTATDDAGFFYVSASVHW
nr:ShlB/FhaC/HecB family hemolysin secretion/activation protein [Rhizobium sp. Root1203]